MNLIGFKHNKKKVEYPMFILVVEENVSVCLIGES